jgi:hypothetical protein
MKKIILFLGCCLLGWGATGLFAQQGNTAAGGQADGPGGTVSYSIGLVNFISATGASGSVTQGVQHPGGGFSLCGTLTYDNVAGTAMNNCTVQLKQGNVVVYETTTDANGFYSFSNPVSGSYVLSALTTKPWGSVNATDALLIGKHFTEITLLSGLKLDAADVNASNYVNSSDGLGVLKRFAALQNSFPAGDWMFNHPVVVIDGVNLVVDFKGICVGDVNASYTPPSVKLEPTLFLENRGVQTIENQQIVRLPVTLNQALNCAAVSLVMNYPVNALEILSVEAAYDNSTLVYNTIGDALRIGWYSLQPKEINKDEVLMTLTVKLRNAANYVDLNFGLNAESSIADYSGVAFTNKSLSIPSLVSSLQGFTLSQNIPNPFTSTTQISYVLPADGSMKLELLDVVGKQIAVLEDGQQTAGAHTYTFSGNALPDGVYFYRMVVNTGSQQYSQTKRMVISR